jgi:AcrR family transcriptional regulator
LFRDKGYVATTIRDIADAVQMRSGSPFYHFKTKQHILRAVVLEGIAEIHAVVSAVATSKKPLRQRFEAMMAAHLEVILGESGRDFAAAVLHESRHLDAEAQRELIRHKDIYEALWQDVLTELKQAGMLVHDKPVNRLFLLGAMNWTTQWYHPQGKLTSRTIARQLADFVLTEPR